MPLGCAQNRDHCRTQPESAHISKVAGQRAFVVIIHLINVGVTDPEDTDNQGPAFEF